MGFKVILLTLLFLGIMAATKAQRYRQIQVAIGDHCALGAAPVGGGGFQVVERGVRKICAQGTSCRNGACNCDNLRDGTVTGISTDARGNRSCRRVAGQRCSSDNDCFQDVRCARGVCTCDRSRNDFCVDQKNDVYILA